MADAARLAALLCLLPTLAIGFEVVDGDTLKDDQGQRLRIIGLDAPEIRGKCEYEKGLAREAKAYLQTLDLDVTYTGRSDRYGRALVRVFSGGRDIAEIMVEKGLARAYVCPNGRCPPRRSWCD